VGLGSLGTTQHMAVELLRHEMRLSFTTVPYRGGALALQDLIGGTIDVLCDGFPSSIPHVRQGSIKALGVTSIERVPGAPDIPSVAETIPGFSSTGWFGVAGPAGLPAAIVERLNRAVNEALTDPALRRKHDEIGARIHGGTPRQFAEHIRREVARWHEVVKATGARAA
ncbi:MAG: Bug family tripartite tricarboxylate transporter substrate binding protein, partial [Burkholderiaceae bacterium]